MSSYDDEEVPTAAVFWGCLFIACLLVAFCIGACQVINASGSGRHGGSPTATPSLPLRAPSQEPADKPQQRPESVLQCDSPLYIEQEVEPTKEQE